MDMPQNRFKQALRGSVPQIGLWGGWQTPMLQPAPSFVIACEP
jgi:2-keto-3-deoxy-L-rhamnonate aldolase RhmA